MEPVTDDVMERVAAEDAAGPGVRMTAPEARDDVRFYRRRYVSLDAALAAAPAWLARARVLRPGPTVHSVLVTAGTREAELSMTVVVRLVEPVTCLECGAELTDRSGAACARCGVRPSEDLVEEASRRAE